MYLVLTLYTVSQCTHTGFLYSYGGSVVVVDLLNGFLVIALISYSSRVSLIVKPGLQDIYVTHNLLSS